ncbi:MAG: AAA family ATPase [Muribaculaceae bacterium]|nr:AAA family ATPase [Muribaculaceae bacterium]
MKRSAAAKGLAPRRASDTADSDIDFANPEFRRLVQMVEDTNQSIFLTGKAGTGKSTFLRYIIGHTAKKCAVLAPTGIAAVNVGGQTLHSFFHLPLQPVLPDDPDFHSSRPRDRLSLTGRSIKLFKEIELIVIDEISMVRADIIDLIDRILRTFGGDRRKPFGGKQLLLVGDVFKLEPVVTQEDKSILQKEYSYPFFFNARVFATFGLVSIELRKVYRQQQLDFVEILDRFRAGTPDRADMQAINNRLTDPDSKPQARIVMTLASRRDIVKQINDAQLDRLRGRQTIYRGDVSGDFPSTAYPTDLELRLKKGAQVIFLRNDPERRFVNGTLGIVAGIKADALTVSLEDGTDINVEPATWENVSYQYEEKTKRVSTIVKGTFTQFPVKAAWALTIHKSQGLTFDRIVIDLGRSGAFAGGQVYVALSRCTSLEGIELRSPIDARDVFVHPEVLRFSRTFNDIRAQEEALRAARAETLLADAEAAYSRGDNRTAVELFNRAIISAPHLNTPAFRRLVAMKLSRPTLSRRKKPRKP